MMKNKLYIYLFFISTFLFSCKPKNKLLGKWYNESNWFEYTTDSTYNTGIDKITFFTHLKYTLDPKSNDLIMYTDKKEVTYYLKCTFINADTIELKNMMNGGKTAIKYYKLK